MTGPGKLRVVGLDLSLTSTGAHDGTRGAAFQTEPGGRLEERLDYQVGEVMVFVTGGSTGTTADLAVIEAGAFSRGAQSGAAEILSALRLMVRHRLWRLGVPYALVTPTTLKKYVTGHGKTTKPEMVSAVDCRYRAGLADIKVAHGRYDLADALGLAAMGYDHVEQPLYEHGYEIGAPGPHRASLDAVQWPDLTSD